MDILTDILQSADIKKSLLLQRAIYKPWAIRFPCERSMGFHVVTQGEVYLRSPRIKEPLLLRKGDLILLARGFEHELATDLKVKAKGDIQNTPTLDSAPGSKPLATLASGVYHFAMPPIHPLFQDIPEKVLFRSNEIAAHDPLHSALLLLSSELAQNEMGSEAVTRNLLDILFHYILRSWMNSVSEKQGYFNAALKDANLRKALKAIHEQPQNAWSVESLAEVSGLSRAAFAQKFKKQTGDTPAHYLSKVRIQKAAQILRQGQYNVEQVAELVGYQDSFVFSKVFKRLQGMSPREYKRL